MADINYAQLNIGRGNIELESDWETFIALCEAALAGSTVYSPDEMIANVQVHEGWGEWHGVVEESAHISFYTEAAIDQLWVRDRARHLAQMFGQDSIAVIFGSELVNAHG